MFLVQLVLRWINTIKCSCFNQNGAIAHLFFKWKERKNLASKNHISSSDVILWDFPPTRKPIVMIIRIKNCIYSLPLFFKNVYYGLYLCERRKLSSVDSTENVTFTRYTLRFALSTPRSDISVYQWNCSARCSQGQQTWHLIISVPWIS